MKKKVFLALLIVAVAVVYFAWWTKGGKDKVLDVVKIFNPTEQEVTKANMNSLAKKMLSFVAQEGRTPNSLREFQLLFGSLEAAEDAWGTTLRYERISEEDFRIVSAGKDKIFNTADDIVLKF
ncbi:MAG: hypothetical protein JSV46_02465 [Candidatus Aminicenantes bacterium]|nr:MAG: hypothetical protein JSV46_02465 [Candidatus Aminicenantes bacterium]